MYYIGLDLGQRRDHSAIVILERREFRTAYRPTTLDLMLVRHAERVPLGTPYPNVVARIRYIVASLERDDRCCLIVDATGVGAPVVEMLRTAALHCELKPVTITGGDRESKFTLGGTSTWSVPKQDLLAGVQVLLDQEELKIANTRDWSAPLFKELLNMRVNQNHRGKLKLGAEGTDQHDDLVIALALSCWGASRKRSGFGTQRLIGI